MPTKANNSNSGEEQPYIPAGNGEKSGEYTFAGNSSPEVEKEENKKLKLFKINKRIHNIINKCNFCDSKLVKKVEFYASCTRGYNIPITYKPNSVAKKLVGDYVVQERYFDEKGNAYLDIDYTCHKNPNTHPDVPHIHRWENVNGVLIREKGDKFK